MKKWIAWTLGLIGAALIGYLVLGKPITVRMSEDSVREQVAKKLPMTIEKSGVTALVTGVDLDFLANDKVAVAFEMDLDGYGVSGHASGATTSGIRYQNGNFYLTDLDLTDLKVTPSQASEDVISDIETSTKSLWGRFKNKHLSDDSAAGAAMDRLAARAIDKLKPTAIAIANDALKTTPVYSLNGKDMKMDLAALALEEVRFSDTAVEADLDPRNVILWALGIALLILSAIIISGSILLGGGGGALAFAGIFSGL